MCGENMYVGQKVVTPWPQITFMWLFRVSVAWLRPRLWKLLTNKTSCQWPDPITRIKVKQTMDMLKPYMSLCSNSTFVEQNFSIFPNLYCCSQLNTLAGRRTQPKIPNCQYLTSLESDWNVNFLTKWTFKVVTLLGIMTSERVRKR